MMTEQSAEEAARARAHALVAGDFATTLRFMTPDALARAMELGITNWHYSSFELRQQTRDGDGYLFDIAYHGGDETLTLRDRFRQIEGEWKIVDIERIV